MKQAEINLLKKWVSYNPETGELTWLRRKPRTGFSARDKALNNIGDIIATQYKSGYIYIPIFSQKYYAHVVAYQFIFGSYDGEVDHINHNKLDNRIKNLRKATRAEQMRNQTIRKTNTSGHTGVYFRTDTLKWTSKLKHNGKWINLGCFRTFEQACKARQEANEKYGYHSNHGT
jgi:ribosomal protein L15